MRLGTTMFNETYDFDFFDEVNYIKIPKDLDNVDCLVLWGGTDIATEIYGETPNKFVLSHKKSLRDIQELALIQAALKRNMPIIGICRGAQLMCCVSGGKLLQHIENHGISHKVRMLDEQVTLDCNSSHHQMMMPPISAIVLGVADESTFGINQHNGVVNVPMPYEVVFFPNTKALGIQPHPEWDDSPVEFNAYVTRKIKQYLFPEKQGD